MYNRKWIKFDQVFIWQPHGNAFTFFQLPFGINRVQESDYIRFCILGSGLQVVSEPKRIRSSPFFMILAVNIGLGVQNSIPLAYFETQVVISGLINCICQVPSSRFCS